MTTGHREVATAGHVQALGTERLRERAAAFFLAPARPSPSPRTATVPAQTRAVVLGASGDAMPVAAALALTLRAAERSPTALVAVWEGDGHHTRGHEESPADPIPRGIATRAASRLAARLALREVPAVARGRLAWLRLPDAPELAAAALRRTAAVVDAPVVTALAGPRPAELEPLVDEHDLVVIAAEPGGPLAAAAIAAFGDRCVSAIACRPLARGPARALALAGLAAPRLDPPLRAARPHTG
jgi:hypothetical protein